jgi:glycosyltransferase involved in cell wall biosynthesis
VNSETLEMTRQRLAELKETHRKRVLDFRERLTNQAKALKAAQRDLRALRKKQAETRQALHGAFARAAKLQETVNALSAELAAERKERKQREREVAWVKGDRTNETTGWAPAKVSPPPYITGRRSRIQVLLLNSIGGSMGRLSKALMLHEGIDADVMIGAYAPRRNMLYPHEPNVYGVFSHHEWRSYLTWAVNEYDLIQTTSLPIHPAVAECYDWLTELLGRRHIWRETGFVHHYLLREDILPLETYFKDLKWDQPPGRERYAGKTFSFTDTHILTDPFVMLYSSPEKGAYFQGTDTLWLPSMRDPATFCPPAEPSRPGDSVKVYVPYHGGAKLKGLTGVLADLDRLQAEGAPIEVLTSDRAVEVFPDLCFAGDSEHAAASYPIPSHKMPELYRRVDVVVDQLVMGCYGNTGIEAMFSGKPVIGQKRYAEVADAPIWDADRENFRDRFLDLLDRRDEWAAMGEAGREYAMRRHSPRAVARIAGDLYRRLMEECRN